MRQSSSRTRTISSTGRCANGPRRGRLETAALILAAGDFDDTSLNPIGHGRKSKALLPVGNKPQLFHTIELLESSGFDKEAIFVAIEQDDLIDYEDNERIVPFESRLPARNMLKVKDPQSSSDTLADGLFKLSQLEDGLPQYVLVVYVDIIACGVLNQLAKFNRSTDAAFVSVYGPQRHSLSELKAFPGGEAPYKEAKPSKLTFFGGDHVQADFRRLKFAIDTECILDDTLKLSRRLMSSSDHIEVASDLIDQGVFMMRNDVAHWVMANAEDRDSIRGSLIPSLLKRQYETTADLAQPFDCFALIDNESTWRLDSLHNYVEAHRAIIAGHLLKHKASIKYQSLRSEKNIDCCPDTILGDFLERFNEREEQAEAENGSGECVEKSRVIMRKCILGDYCAIEYEARPADRKCDISIQNCIIMSNVKIHNGCRLNNCLISNGAVIGSKCNLTNCIIGPEAIVASLTNQKDTIIGLPDDCGDIVLE